MPSYIDQLTDLLITPIARTNGTHEKRVAPDGVNALLRTDKHATVRCRVATCFGRPVIVADFPAEVVEFDPEFKYAAKQQGIEVGTRSAVRVEYPLAEAIDRTGSAPVSKLDVYVDPAHWADVRDILSTELRRTIDQLAERKHQVDTRAPWDIANVQRMGKDIAQQAADLALIDQAIDRRNVLMGQADDPMPANTKWTADAAS